MGELIGAALGLGLAGLDPAGALIAVAALAAGVRDRAVLLFGLVVLLGTAAWGTALAVTVGSRLAEVNWWVLLPAGRGGAIIELVIGAGLLAWAFVRVLSHSSSSPKRRKPTKPRMSTSGLLGTGTLFVLSATLDPTFVALAVVTGRSDSVAAVGGAQLIWSLISQAPLLVLLIAVARGGHEKAVQRFQAGWKRAAPTLGHVVTGALVVVGSMLLLDAVWWFVTGEFLFPAP